MWTSIDSYATVLAATALFLQRPAHALSQYSRGSLGSAVELERRASQPYIDPRTVGGSMLTINNATLGEPLNAILSADSDHDVLQRTLDNGGFLNYMLSTYLAAECLHEHYGGYQSANLGQGNVTQLEELRWDYGDQYIGTCKETFNGGLHLRYWIQNSTGAYFMAVSLEEDLDHGHDIPANGYNEGRDYLVGNVTGITFNTRNVTNQTTFVGNSSFNDYKYQTSVKYVSGLLNYSNDDVNHYDTVSVDGYPAIDGLVAVLTVKIVSRPAATSAAFHMIASTSYFVLFGCALLAGLGMAL